MKKSELIEIAEEYGITLKGKKIEMTATLVGELRKMANQLSTDLAWHDNHRNCYFWQPRGGARQRRQEEERGTFEHVYTLRGHKYEYESSVRCSTKNYYYRSGFYVDGLGTTVRKFRPEVEKLRRLAQEIECA